VGSIQGWVRPVIDREIRGDDVEREI